MIFYLGSTEPLKETKHKPSFMSDDDLRNLISEATGGFIIVVECDRGQVLYVTDSVEEILNISQVLTYFRLFCGNTGVWRVEEEGGHPHLSTEFILSVNQTVKRAHV